MSISHACAMCLENTSTEHIKFCGGCMKRAYCSKECQMRDWKAKNGGQGHKHWCKLKCCEEGIDWEVREIPFKGLGLVAKRLIPSLSRIIVDGLRSIDDPVVATLQPSGGTIIEKYELNSLGGGKDGVSYLCGRIARANHDCNPNAAHYLDETFNVKILFSERDIQPGEEICISYTGFSDCAFSITAENARFYLRQKWNIQCSNGCYCYKNEVIQMALRAKCLDDKIYQVASTTSDTVKALQLIRELLDIHETLPSSQVSKMRTFYDGFQIAIMKKSTISAANSFIRAAYEIKSQIVSPQSKEAQEMLAFINNPSAHRNYLIREL